MTQFLNEQINASEVTTDFDTFINQTLPSTNLTEEYIEYDLHFYSNEYVNISTETA